MRLLLRLAISIAWALAGLGTLVYVVFVESHFRGVIVAALVAGFVAAIGFAGIAETILEMRRGPDQ